MSTYIYIHKVGKHKTKRDTTKINPIPTPVIPPSWNAFIVLRLSGRPVSLYSGASYSLPSMMQVEFTLGHLSGIILIIMLLTVLRGG